MNQNRQGLIVRKAVRLQDSVVQSAVWRVSAPEDPEGAVWVSCIHPWGWVASYAPGCGLAGMRAARALRGRSYPTRRALVEDLQGAFLLADD